MDDVFLTILAVDVNRQDCVLCRADYVERLKVKTSFEWCSGFALCAKSYEGMCLELM